LESAFSPGLAAGKKPGFLPFLDQNPSSKMILEVADFILEVAEMVLEVAEMVLAATESTLEVTGGALAVAKTVLEVGETILEVTGTVLAATESSLEAAGTVLEVVAGMLANAGFRRAPAGTVRAAGLPKLPCPRQKMWTDSFRDSAKIGRWFNPGWGKKTWHLKSVNGMCPVGMTGAFGVPPSHNRRPTT
jgi:hypothetical protein